MEVEADAEVDIDIGDIATVRIRGGRRDAQRKAEALEARWRSEVEPHLAAAKVADLDGLSAKIAEAQALDASIKAKDAELQSLQAQIDSLIDSAQNLREALERKKACRAALGHVPLETLLPDLLRSALSHRMCYESADSRHLEILSRLARRRIRPVPPILSRKNVLRIRNRR